MPASWMMSSTDKLVNDDATSSRSTAARMRLMYRSGRSFEAVAAVVMFRGSLRGGGHVPS
jgi:hypothetical protein